MLCQALTDLPRQARRRRLRPRTAVPAAPAARALADYLAAYNFAKHLKALRWRTPYETLGALWASRPELFRRSPDHLTLGPNT